MRKLICLAALLGGLVLPMVEAQAVVHRPGHNLVHRNRRQSHRAWRHGHWVYW